MSNFGAQKVAQIPIHNFLDDEVAGRNSYRSHARKHLNQARPSDSDQRNTVRPVQNERSHTARRWIL